MQLGRLELIDQAQAAHIEKISKIQETDKKSKVDPDDQYKNLQFQIAKEDAKEIILDNVKFGYNIETKDFFVRIQKGASQYQYPTEDMMKLKKNLMEAYQNLKQNKDNI